MLSAMAGSKVDMKIVLLGKQNGGKTSLIERFMYDRFSEGSYQATIGAAFGAKMVEVNGRNITLGIWDTAGTERHQALSPLYYRGAMAAIICYDLTDSGSFDKAKLWVAELKKSEENCKIYLCGTKKDLIEGDKTPRQVDYSTTTKFAEELHAELFETSSKTGHSVRDLFFKIASDYAKDAPNRIRSEPSSVELEDRTTNRSKCCFSSS